MDSLLHCFPGLVSVWGSSVSRNKQLVSALRCCCSDLNPHRAEESLQTQTDPSMKLWAPAFTVKCIILDTAQSLTCWGLDASLALSLRLDHAKASLNVALEELWCVFEVGLHVCVRVLLFVFIQLCQALKTRPDTLFIHSFIHVFSLHLLVLICETTSNWGCKMDWMGPYTCQHRGPSLIFDVFRQTMSCDPNCTASSSSSLL